jgi:hypothetical protein
LHIVTIELERKLKEKEYTDFIALIDDYGQSLNLVLHDIAAYRKSRSPANQPYTFQAFQYLKE